MKRTHSCGALTTANAGQSVIVMGWVNTRRDHGQLVFVDLRDRAGITQVVFEATNATVHDLAKTLRSEFVIAATGKVRARGEGLVNPNLKTGQIEIVADPGPVADLRQRWVAHRLKGPMAAVFGSNLKRRAPRCGRRG